MGEPRDDGQRPVVARTRTLLAETAASVARAGRACTVAKHETAQARHHYLRAVHVRHAAMRTRRSIHGPIYAMAQAWQDTIAQPPLDPVAALVEAITDYAIFRLDRDGYVLTCNGAAERITGYTRDDVVGRHFSVLYYEGGDRQAQHELATALAKDGYHDEDWRMRKDGSRFWASVALTPLRAGDGRLAGFAKVIRDDTTRLAAASERRRADAALLREQIATELHHDVILDLFGIGLSLQGALSVVEGPPEARARIEDAVQGLDNLIRNIRTTLWRAGASVEDDDDGAVPAQQEQTDSLQILVVDDDEDMRALLTAALNDVGVVQTAPDVYEALAWLEGHPVDVLVVDLVLPGASGVDLLERLSALGRNVPTVVVSGLGDGELVEHAHDLGAAVVMSKPFDMRLLRANLIEAARRAASSTT